MQVGIRLTLFRLKYPVKAADRSNKMPFLLSQPQLDPANRQTGRIR